MHDPATGSAFAIGAFLAEIENSKNIIEALRKMQLTAEEVKSDPALNAAFTEAVRQHNLKTTQAAR